MDLSKITVNMQSSIRIEGEKILYFDPFAIEGEAHDADMIFITHKHYDHFQPESIARIKKEETIIVAPVSMERQILDEIEIDRSHCEFCAPGTMREVCGIMVETVPAYNKFKPFHMKGEQWQGYIVNVEGSRIYVAGDTDPNKENKQVKCDIAIIPIGGHYTMDKKVAADFVTGIKPKVVIPTHYGQIVGLATDGVDFKDYVEIIDEDILVELKLDSSNSPIEK